MGYDVIQKGLEWAGIAISGLDLISKLTKTTADDKAVDALAAIRKITGALDRGHTGSISLEECAQEIQEIRRMIASHDAAADARLHERFPDGDD